MADIRTYTTRDEAIQREVIEPLGKDVNDFNTDAIADEVIVGTCEIGGDFKYTLDPYADFWETVQKHTKPEQPAAGTRVQGKAAVGNKVTYFDMANQDGKVWEVVSLPEDNVDPKWGWTSGYQLRGEDGTESWSDLRQHGWTFA